MSDRQEIVVGLVACLIGLASFALFFAPLPALAG